MRRLLCVVVMTICVRSGMVFADRGGFVIRDYDVDLALHTDGTMDVQERITVDFSEPRHGIYREIPLVAPSGYAPLIKRVNVHSHNAKVTRESRMLRIRMGDPAFEVTGEQVYDITYSIRNAIYTDSRLSGSSHRMSRNAIGTERTTPITRATITLRADPGMLSGMDAAVYTCGYAGDRDQCGVTQRDGETYIVQTARPLAAGEGLTITAFPLIDLSRVSGKIQDVAHASSDDRDVGATRHRTTLWINRFVSRIVGIAAVCGVSLAIRGVRRLPSYGTVYGTKKQAPQGYRNTKRPKDEKRAATIYYTPPKDVPLHIAINLFYGDMGYEQAVDGATFDTRLICAVLYEYMVKGYIRIEQPSKPWWMFWHVPLRLHQTYETAGATEQEQEILRVLFGDATSIRLEYSKKQYNRMHLILRAIDDWTDAKEYTQPVDDNDGGEKGLVQRVRRRFAHKHKLTPAGKEVYEHVRGFAMYLHSVERPVLERELRHDPDYLTTLMPWVIGFGLTSQYTDDFGDLLEQIDTGSTNLSTSAMIQSMSSGVSSVSSQPSSSSSSSGGSSSGGGGGGGGGGSW